MKRIVTIILTVILTLSAETLFEVKDASNNKVLDVSTDGLRVMNQGDTLMVISSNEIKANLQSSKGLSRSFSVTTASSKGSENDLMRLTSDSTRFWISDTGSGFGVSSQTAAKEKSVATNFLKVSNANTEMREGIAGNRYTDFSPENMFLGLNAGIATTPFIDLNRGINNLFIGNNTGVSNSIGYDNVFIGTETGFNNIEGTYNVFIGHKTGYKSNGSVNLFIGNHAGYENISGSMNSFVGHSAGYNNQSGIYNTFLGYASGFSKTSGDQNVLIGPFAGNQNYTGSNNVMIGIGTGYYSSGSDNVFIGSMAGANETGSNKLFIENSDTTTPLIYGEFDNDFVKINGKLGVGINPTYRLHVLDETTYSDQPAIFGKHNVTDTYGVGVKGEGGLIGVDGYANATGSYTLMGVRGNATGTGSGVRYGVYGTATGGATNYAGYFSGNVYVTGNLYANDYIEFKSDHPIDPENKYLTLSSVSSSEMLNVYSGNIVLDEKGNATVQMPDWFEAYNAEFRYQLTGIGSSAPGLYISDELNSGKFGIGGGNPGMKVSWMVTAVRNDNYAKANPIQVVSEKKDNEKGYYLTPEVFGRSKERSIESMYEKEADKEREK